jgi:ribosomal-protein-alanine N-acetyltransferase
LISKLRSAGPADFETLYEIDQACYEPEIAYSRRELRRYLRFPGAECVVAETDETISGFCISTLEDNLGYIITMDVLGLFRRKGVGTALLGEVESRLAAKHVEAVFLETATDNQPGIAFWTRHGYGKQGVREGYYPGGRDAYTMAKIISGSPRSPA